MDSSPLGLLQPELIFWILNSLEPNECSGFSQSCREALNLSKRCSNVKENFADVAHRRAAELGNQDSPRRTRAGSLAALPPELLYHIFDLMEPH